MNEDGCLGKWVLGRESERGEYDGVLLEGLKSGG